MSIKLNDNIEIDAPKPSDPRFGPWASLAAALAGVKVTNRYVGLSVGILNGSGEAETYRFRSSTDDAGLVKVVGGPTSTDGLSEGATNQYFTSARVLTALISGYVRDGANRALAEGMSLLAALGVLEKKIDDNTASIAPIKKTIILGYNVGNGSQAAISVGGYGNNITGLESGSIGGGGITITGADSGSVAGSAISISGINSGSVGGTQSTLTGSASALIGGFANRNAADEAGIMGGRGLTLPAGATYSAIVGGLSFSAPILPETLFVPQLYIFKPGKGICFVSPTTAINKVLSINDSGVLLFDGNPVGASNSTANSGIDSRKDLATFNGARTNTLVFESKNVFSNPVLGPNCQSFSAQVIKASVAPATAVSAPRTGTPAQVLSAINADILGLGSADSTLIYVRFITVPVSNTDESHLILTVLPL